MVIIWNKNLIKINKQYEILNNENIMITTLSNRKNGDNKLFLLGTYIPPVNKRKDGIDIKECTINLLSEIIERINNDFINPNIFIYSDFNTNLLEKGYK